MSETNTKHFIICPRCNAIEPPGFESVPQSDRRVSIAPCSQCTSITRCTIWDRICPPAFLNTNPAELPNQEASFRACNWGFIGGKGLTLHGPTRRGKSRTAWLIGGRFVVDEGLTVVGISSREIGIDLPATMGQDMSQAVKAIDGWIAAHLLILDDAFKVKITERVEQILFTVIDERMNSMRPIILTTNDTGPSLRSRLSSDRGDALIERLRESTEQIAF